MKDDTKQPTTFTQAGVEQKEKTLEDFFDIRGGVLNLLGIMQTANFISGARGVQIRNEGLNSSGGTIQGAAITGGSTASTLIAGVTGILKGNGANPVTAIAGVSGTFFVANSSGGSPTHLVTVTNGVIVSIA